MSPAPDPLLGRVLAGTYRLDELLGRGAMGTVYRAQHRLLGDPYAVKVLHPELAEEEDLRHRFLQEARALARFSHKNAVAVRHCGEEDGLVFLAMDLCRGETLEALLLREGALPEARAVALTLQALAALEEAHKVGIVHRDLKPANVMVEPGRPGEPEVARVLDFGLSRILTEGREGAAAARVSALGEVVGTVAYMSPEQALGEDLDARSDLFSLGVLLYEMVEGRHPFLGGTMASVITRLLEVEHVLAEPAVPRKASAGLQRVLGHALQRDRAHRFPDATAFAAALRDLQAGREVAPPPDPAAEARGRARRRVALVAVGVLALLVGGVVWLRSAPTTWEDSTTRPIAEVRATGAAALAEGRWKDAVTAYASVVLMPRSTAEDRLALAEARIRVGDPEAERDLTAAARELGADVRVDLAWGRYHHRLKGDPDRALESFLRALGRDKRSVAARLARLDLYLDAAHAKALDAKPERRLGLAALDVAALEGVGATPAEVALAKSRLAAVVSEQSGQDRARLLSEALASARLATAADTHWSAGPVQVGNVLSKQAAELRDANRPEEALALVREWIDAEAEALRRLRANRAYRAQGGDEVAQLRRLVSARVHASQGDEVVREAEELGRLALDDAVTLREVALLLRWAGDFEKALPVYERLVEIGTDHSVQSDLAFCHQRIAVGHLLGGKRAEGVASLERALAAYDETVALAPGSAVVRAYRGETRTYLARWDAARRAEHLEQARADLEFAATQAEGKPSERSEVLYRRAGLRMMLGDLDGAQADIAEIVGDEPALNPALHGRFARVLLAKAARALEEGKADRASALRAEALEQCALAERRSGTLKGPACLLRAQILLLSAPATGAGTSSPGPEDLTAAKAALAAAAEPQALPDGDPTREAAVWTALVDGFGRAAPADTALRAVLTLRRGEVARGQDLPSAAFYTALAAALEQAGDRERADAARVLATHMPPP